MLNKFSDLRMFLACQDKLRTTMRTIISVKENIAIQLTSIKKLWTKKSNLCCKFWEDKKERNWEKLRKEQ